MTTYVVLLRAVNVGGHGKLRMKDLIKLCTDLGFENVRTYIQSGNVIFESHLFEKAIRSRIEKALDEKLKIRSRVFVRTLEELNTVLKRNPFPKSDGAKVGVCFQSDLLKKDFLDEVTAPGGEQVSLGRREIYIFFPNGMGRSKLKLPHTEGTMRNMKTVAKLVELATKKPGSKAPKEKAQKVASKEK